MKINIKNKKFISFILIFVFLGVFLTNINIAKAGWLSDVVGDLLLGVFSTLQIIAGVFAGLMGNILTFILNFSFRDMDQIHEAWKIVRDIVNMFFIFGLVIIAFATILRNEQYGIKKLLPKLLIMALLINFSYVLSATIVDFSQIITNHFLGQIDTSTGSIREVGGAIAHQLNIKDAIMSETQTVPISYQNPDSAMILTAAFSAAILFAAGFVMLIGAVLLIIRTGAIWALLILAPIAWFFSIFPKLKTHTDKWWEEFFKWTFFAPIYVFFIYLILKIADKWKITTFNSPSSLESVSTIPIIGDLNILFKFIFLVILLFGAPVIGMSMGLKGSQVVTSTIKGGFKKARKWTGKQAIKPIRMAGAGALTAGGGLFGGKIGGRMKARGYQMKQKAAEYRWSKAFQTLLPNLTDDNVLKETHTKGIKGLLAVQEAKKRGILREADRDHVKKSMKVLRAYGGNEEARTLEEIRPDAVENGTKRNEAIERARNNGNDKKWSSKVFKAPEGTEIMGEYQRQLGSSEFIKTFKTWPKDMQKVAEEAIISGFTDDFDTTKDSGKDNIRRRETHAVITGDLKKSFEGIESKIEKYIEGWGNESFKVLNKPYKPFSKSSREIVVKFMNTSQVEGAGINLNGDVKKEMMKYAKIYNKPVFEQMQKSLNWGGKPSAISPPMPQETSEQRKKRVWGEIPKITKEEEQKRKRRGTGGNI